MSTLFNLICVATAAIEALPKTGGISQQPPEPSTSNL